MPSACWRTEGLHAGVADRRGVRHLPARVRRAVPPLLAAYDRTPRGDPLKASSRSRSRSCARWDRRWSAESVPTTLAVFWGEELWQRVRAARDARPISTSTSTWKRAPPPRSAWTRCAAASDKLAARLRDVEAALGRDQPLPAPRPATSCSRSTTASRASRSASPRRGGVRWPRSARGRTTARRRCTARAANSFVAAVEFGDRVRAQGGHRRRRERRSRRRRTSTTRPRATRPAICATSTSIPISCRGTSSAPTIRESDSRA